MNSKNTHHNKISPKTEENFMQYLCKIFFKLKLIRKIIGRNSYETDSPPSPSCSW